MQFMGLQRVRQDLTNEQQQKKKKKENKLLSGKGSNNRKDNTSAVKTPSHVSMIKTSLKHFPQLFFRL